MGLILVTPPTEEPVDRDVLKDHLRIHRDVDDWDLHLDRLNLSARGYVEEAILRKQLIPATWKLVLDAPPRRRIGGGCGVPYLFVPRPPLIEIVRIRYRDTSNQWQEMDEADYVVETTSEPGRVYPVDGWPITSEQPGSFEVEFQAGYMDRTRIPQMVTVAIAEMVRQMFGGGEVERAAASVAHLLMSFRCLDDRVNTDG